MCPLINARSGQSGRNTEFNGHAMRKRESAQHVPTLRARVATSSSYAAVQNGGNDNKKNTCYHL
eukprot:3865872-Amphidinium_carterae.1